MISKTVTAKKVFVIFFNLPTVLCSRLREVSKRVNSFLIYIVRVSYKDLIDIPCILIFVGMQKERLVIPLILSLIS